MPFRTRNSRKGPVMFGYSLNYLIDTKEAVIVDVEATPTRISKEVAATETMVARTQERFDLKPDNIAGDAMTESFPARTSPMITSATFMSARRERH